jgi:hypothetical protein
VVCYLPPIPSGAKARRAGVVRVLDVIEGQNAVLGVIRLRERDRDAAADLAAVFDDLARQRLNLCPVKPTARALKEGTDPAAAGLCAGDVEAVRVEPVIRRSADVLVKLERHAVSRAEAAASAVDAEERLLRVGGCLLQWGGSSQEGESGRNDCESHFVEEILVAGFRLQLSRDVNEFELFD